MISPPLRPVPIVPIVRIALAALLATAPAAALEVAILSPPPGAVVFGVVQVAVEVRGGEARKVELFLDGARVATAERPPWKLRVDVGEENVERTLRVVATAVHGERAVVERVLPAMRVDEVVELELQQLYVTVTRDGEPVQDLDRSDFRVEDGGAKQELVTFERGDAPITAAVLLDASLSMRGEPLASALAGARAFSEGLAELDEASLLLVSDRTLRRTPFAHDPGILLGGLDGAVAAGGSAVNDHLYLALSELERRQGRRVVILLSDGVDLDSVLTVRDLEPVTGRSQVLLYWLRLGGDQTKVRRRSVWRDFDEHTAELAALEHLVERSGGRILDLPAGGDPRTVFQEVLAELRGQYVLGWYPSASRGEGDWRELRVNVARLGVRLRAREGYYDD